MNGMQNQQMGSTWHATCSVSDRQRVILVLATTLKNVQGNNFDDQKSAAITLDLEKYAFMRATSKEEYFRMIKQKVNQLRMRGNPQAVMNNGQSNDMGNQNLGNQGMVNQNMNQMGNQNMANQNMGSQGMSNQGMANQNMANQGMANQNINSNFMPHQQNVQVMRNNLLAQQQQQQQQRQAGQPQTQQLLQIQVQQISEMIRTAPIPPALLAKIPNLPANVNTWTQIYECVQKKMIPASLLPLIKEIHHTHFQIALRLHQQLKLAQFQKMSANNQGGDASAMRMQQNQNQQFNMNTNNTNSNMNSNMGNMGNMNMGGMNNMKSNAGNVNNNANKMANMKNMANMVNMNRQLQGNNMNIDQQQNGFQGNNKPQAMQQLQQQPQMQMSMGPQLQQQNLANGMKPQPQQRQPQQLISNQNTGMGQNQQQPAAGGKDQVPNIAITPQDLQRYSGDALAMLQKLQQSGSIQPNLDQTQKLNFIRKYIAHQKLAQWKAQKSQQNVTGQPQQSMNQGAYQQMPQQGQQQSQQLQTQQQQQQQQPQAPPQSMMQQNVVGQQHQHLLPLMGQMTTQANTTPMLNQGTMNQQQMFSPMMAQKLPQAQQAGNNVNNNKQMRPNAAPSFMPPLTDEMKMKLRSLFEEVGKNSLPLKDMTMVLTEKDKSFVKESMARITQQFANVDSILSYFYVLTRNLEGTKKLIQMKHMTKNIMESLQQGIYLAGPDLVDKLRSQYQKFFDYVKEQVQVKRQQQMGQQPAQQQPAGRQMQGSFSGSQQFGAPNVQQQQQQQPPIQGQGFPVQGGVPQRGMPQGIPQQQGFANNVTNQQQQDWQKPNSNLAPQRIGGALASSPIMPAASPPVSQAATKQKAAANKRAGTGAANNRRKSKQGSTPSASAPTPATLANAIKTPNSIATPQIPQTQSNKGTPVDNSPHLDMKNQTNVEVPLIGEVFGVSSVDSKVMKRRELSTINPEKFFFAALSNVLDIEEPTEGQNGTKLAVGGAYKPLVKSPLSPNVSGEWSCDVKPFAIASAFRQVEYIRELTAVDILDECRDIVEQEAIIKNENSVKREREDDIDLLFGEKKVKTEDDKFEKYLYEPVEFDEWKSWMNSLQQTNS